MSTLPLPPEPPAAAGPATNVAAAPPGGDAPLSHADAELARALLRRGEFESLSEEERRRVGRALRGMRVARDTSREFERDSSFGERAADRLATLGGSWGFIFAFLAFLGLWAFVNVRILGPRHAAFDPYPFIFLNLMLSMLAALQAPVIMMSQNRQAARDRVEARNDYEVNLKAELEIRALHDRLDALHRDLAALQAALVAPGAERVDGVGVEGVGANGDGAEGGASSREPAREPAREGGRESPRDEPAAS